MGFYLAADSNVAFDRCTLAMDAGTSNAQYRHNSGAYGIFGSFRRRRARQSCSAGATCQATSPRTARTPTPSSPSAITPACRQTSTSTASRPRSGIPPFPPGITSPRSKRWFLNPIQATGTSATVGRNRMEFNKRLHPHEPTRRAIWRSIRDASSSTTTGTPTPPRSGPSSIQRVPLLRLAHHRHQQRRVRLQHGRPDAHQSDQRRERMDRKPRDAGNGHRGVTGTNPNLASPQTSRDPERWSALPTERSPAFETVLGLNGCPGTTSAACKTASSPSGLAPVG